jgi:hypothetical protein
MMLFFAVLSAGSLLLQAPYPTQPDWIEGTDSGITMDVCLFDVDNDNDLDAVTAQYDYENGARLILYVNNNGVMMRSSSWQPSPLACFECVTAGDMNNDGYLDIIAGTVVRMPGDGHNYIYYNSGGTISNAPGWVSTDSKDTYAIQAVDYDRDGLLELITSNQSFRLLFYEHDQQNGLSTSPDDIFKVCHNTSAAISKFIGLDGVNEEGMQMLAAWEYDDGMMPRWPWTGVYELEGFGSTFPPNALYSDYDSKCDCRFNWAVDLDQDGNTDWIGNTGSVLRRGICVNRELDLTLGPIVLPCAEGQIYDPVYRVYYADIAPANGPEIIAASPGIIDPDSPESNRTMLHASNRVYAVVDDWTADQPELTETWASGISDRSTTSIAVGDIDCDGLIRISETKVQSVSNQSYLLNGGLPIEYVESVEINGNPVQFHCDRTRGLLSLVRNMPSGSLPVNVTIEYFISDMQDMFCGMVGNNVVYYHLAR